ncbi:(4Fe-4S)-binding protein [Aureitalea sp. L0-47]|uniref:(4Fe-4S)-binding protein n=1 Tax=Aureitalea sp. L0-47 TaxID=2816962 RepID=UPI002237BE2E|nr:(4Fe-4S)-binding protein [Aureitalea sp. L0-47]MCW5519334.1 (4Fe-4S)-binding protein [Aureitalea sp. L0-47]
MDVRKEYTNGELTVVWKPKLCFHAAECVKGLPDVFDPDRKPWIVAENGSTEDLKRTIDKCPSGALSYYMNSDGPPSEEKQKAMSETKVEVLENGPLMVKGSIEITHTDGSKETKTRNTAFCRCGKTGNNPFCDGSHNK